MSIETLANYGVLGAVLLWFMLRMEKKMDDLSKAINELAITIRHERGEVPIV